jgi:hypothetical protein
MQSLHSLTDKTSIARAAAVSINFTFPAGRYTIPVNYVGYSIFILVFEVVGSSNTVLQGLYLLRRKEYHYGRLASCTYNGLCLTNIARPGHPDILFTTRTTWWRQAHHV